jgi:hypothetical protein
MDKIFTDEFWQTLGALISRHPSVIILLLVAFILGSMFTRWLDGREVRGLKAEKDAVEARLKLAQEEQKAVTPSIEILNTTKLEEDVAVLKTEVAQIRGVILPQSVITQLDKVAATTAMVTSTVRVLSEANTVLKATLTPPYLLNFDDHLGHTYSSEGTAIITKAIQIGATNGRYQELRLKDAYIVSGQGSDEEVKLKVGSDRGWIAPNQVTIPINGRIFFRAEFTPTPAKEFFDSWKTFRITVIHDGGTIHKDIDAKMVAALYAGFSPNPIGPQITGKTVSRG